MNPIRPQDVEDLLTPRETPEPPAGLAERIKAEIPADFQVPPAAQRRGGAVPRSWLLAASVLVALGAGWLGYRTLETAPSLAERSATAVQEAPTAQQPVAKTEAAPVTGEPVAREDAVSDSAGSLDTAGEGPSGTRFEASSQERESAVSRQRDGALARELSALGYAAPTSEPAPQAAAETDADVLLAPEPPATAGRDRPAPRTAAPPRSVTPPPPPPARPGRSVSPPANARERRVPMPDPTPDEPEPELIGELRAQDKQLESVEETIIVTSEAPILDERKISAGAIRTDDRSQAIPKPKVQHDVEAGYLGPSPPNGEPYDAVTFEHAGVNPFVDTEDDALSTFGLDVDTASYSVTRRYLNSGHLPPPGAVRVEEMVNFFDYDDPLPARGEGDFTVFAEGAPTPFTEGDEYRLLRLGIQGRVVEDSDRKPATLIFVVDVSGSMAREDRLELVKRALDLLLGELREDDRVGLVVYGSSGRVVLEPTGDLWAIRSALAELRPDGSTNAEEGLKLGYDLAARSVRRGEITRVILCSDGVANVGKTGPDAILEVIAEQAARGVELTTVGFGMGNYNDVLMERLADRGNGRYAYVDQLEEARRLFVEDLTGQLQTIAAEARAQVEFDPRVVSRYRLLGYENRDIADSRFRDDTVDAGEIGAGHSVTALYEVKLRSGAPRRRPLATLHLRWASEAEGEFVETSYSVRASDLAPSWSGAPQALRRAALVAEFAELLRGSYWAREGSFDRLAREVGAELGGTAEEEWREFSRLVLAARALRP